MTEEDAQGRITVAAGQLDGKITETYNVITEGKNIGRANETTVMEQTEFEAEAKWKKQQDKAYRETVEEAREAAKASHKPMLANKWDDKQHTLKEGMEIAIQPKLDGMRCLARKIDGEVLLTSRAGKPIESVPHLNSELAAFMANGETWDGELYVHGMAFEELMSICKKKAKNLAPNYSIVQFHVFDVVDTEEKFIERTMATRALYDVSTYFHWVPTKMYTIQSRKQFEEYVNEQLKAFEDAGYEGIIIRRLDLPYEHKRSVQLIKVKTFHDEEFTIVGSEDGKKGSRKEGILQCFLLETENTKGEIETFKAALNGSEDKLRDMWSRRDEYVGELATVVYQEKSKYGIPRFPKVKAIRGKEDLCAK